jgi:hypothetical protein
MMRPYRKPAARAAEMKGSAPDVITQAELARAAKLQSEAWSAAEKARVCGKEIEQRIRDGAVVAPGKLIFDRRFQTAARKHNTIAFKG